MKALILGAFLIGKSKKERGSLADLSLGPDAAVVTLDDALDE